MTTVRWEPLRELGSLQSEMNRLFNTVTDGAAAVGGRWTPAMDLVETGEAFVLHADLPGLTSQDVAIEVEEQVLTVSGERKPHTGARRDGFYRVERPFGRFSRSLTLPKGVDADAVVASFAHGVLEVTIPKPVAAKPRRIEISPADDQSEVIEAEDHRLEGSAA